MEKVELAAVELAAVELAAVEEAAYGSNSRSVPQLVGPGSGLGWSVAVG